MYNIHIYSTARSNKSIENTTNRVNSVATTKSSLEAKLTFDIVVDD